MASIVATAGAETAHTTPVGAQGAVVAENGAVVHSPDAMNCSGCPTGAVPGLGVTEMETSSGANGPTVSCAVACTAPTAAVIVVVPVATDVAVVVVAGPGSTVATAWFEDVQVAETVPVVPSANVPVAVKSCVPPSGIVAVGGAMTIETSAGPAAGPTVRAAVPCTDPTVAVIVAVPSATDVAVVVVAGPARTVAVAWFEEVHVAETLPVVPSEKVPVAVKTWVVPSAIVAVGGSIAIDTSEGPDGPTVSTAVACKVPTVAVIVLVPVASDVAVVVVDGPARTVAVAWFEDVQVAETVPVVPSEKVPVAVKTWVVPSGIVAVAGSIVIETGTGGGGVTVSCAVACAVPTVAVIVVTPVAREVAVVEAEGPGNTVAMEVSEDVQVADTGVVEPSENVPVTLKTCTSPSGMVAVRGLIAIESSVAGLIVNVAGAASIPPARAPISVVPATRPVARPSPSMLALVLSTVHSTLSTMRSWLVSSEPGGVVYVPIAWNCTVPPIGAVATSGAIRSVCRTGVKSGLEMPPQPAAISANNPIRIVWKNFMAPAPLVREYCKPQIHISDASASTTAIISCLRGNVEWHFA